MNAFEYFAPTTMKEAVALLSAHPNARVLAGGTDMLVRMKGRVWTPDAVVDIARLPGAKALTFDAKRGLALDTGLNAALNESMEKLKLKCSVESSPDSIYGGAIGAALWGAFRYRKLAELDQLPKAS